MTADLRQHCLDMALKNHTAHDEQMRAARDYYDLLSGSADKGKPFGNGADCRPAPQKGAPVADREPAAIAKRPTDAPPAKPDAENGAGTTLASKKLTGKQFECLGTLIALHNSAVNVTVTALFEAMEDITESGVRYIVNALAERGYVRANRRSSRQTFYIPLMDADGKNVNGATAVTGADGITVTQCPPGYAVGYGLKKTAVEGVI